MKKIELWIGFNSTKKHLKESSRKKKNNSPNNSNSQRLKKINLSSNSKNNLIKALSIHTATWDLMDYVEVPKIKNLVTYFWKCIWEKKIEKETKVKDNIEYSHDQEDSGKR